MTATKLPVQTCSATERDAAAVDLYQGGVDQLWFQPVVNADECKNACCDKQQDTQFQAITSPKLVVFRCTVAVETKRSRAAARRCCTTTSRSLTRHGQETLKGDHERFCAIHLRCASMCACSKKDVPLWRSGDTAPRSSRA